MRFLRAVSLGALLFLAGACEGQQGEGDPADAPDATEGEDAPSGEQAGEQAPAEAARGGTLVVGISSDPDHLNPALTTAGSTHTASELLYNGLVGLDDDLEPLPELAESWDIEEDGRLYRFHLREGVTWHDGEPFTSADVAFTFEEVLLEFHSRTRAALEPALESIETPNDHTVEFRFTEPYAPLLLQLNVTEAPILPRHVYEGTDIQENPANSEPVGTGPFMFVSYQPDAEIVFEDNPDYFRDDLPYLDEVIQRVMPDQSSQVVALEAGEVDWLWGVPGPELERLETDPDVEFLRTNRNPGGANCIMTVAFNLERPTVADLRVRQAIAHALDREQFLDRVLFGEGRVAEAPISSGIPWAHADEVDLPEHDPERAEELLEEAGWQADGDGVRTAEGVEGVEDGTELSIDFLHFPTFSQYGELLRAQLGEVGIAVTQRPLEPPVFVEAVFTDRDFDTAIVSYCNGTDPEIGVRRMYDSDQIGPVPFSNAAAFSNDRVDELFEEARQTVDTDERSPLYAEISEIVVEELPYFWIVETEATRVHSADCGGFRPHDHYAEAAHCE